jgi:inhibitor of cysteine peptidase
MVIHRVNIMRTTYATIVIGCVLILAAGITMGCTGAAAPSPATGTPAAVPPAAVTAPGVQSAAPLATSPAGTATPSTPGTSFRTLFVNNSYNGKIVTVPAGDRVLVRLDENPTTGYTWNATASKGLLIISDSYSAPDTPLLGASGYHEWILAPQTVDTYAFRAVSIRPWEGVKPTDGSFSLVIQATPV